MQAPDPEHRVVTKENKHRGFPAKTRAMLPFQHGRPASLYDFRENYGPVRMFNFYIHRVYYTKL